jgi:hypothetical protein
MTATRVHFTSYVDTKGYKIVPAKRPPRQPGQSEAARVLSSTSRNWAEARIVGIGGEPRAVQLSNYPLLFSKFANVKTPEELLKFITEYGLLTGRKGDEIPPLLDEATFMKEGFKSRGRSLPAWTMANLSASLLRDKTKGTVSVKISPVRLLDALWLQLGQALSEGAEWRQCKHCGDWFPVGGNSGRRLVARFCSDEHRIKFNSLERSR